MIAPLEPRKNSLLNFRKKTDFYMGAKIEEILLTFVSIYDNPELFYAKRLH